MASQELAGQVAVVTGGSRGFGRAIAEALAAAGAAVTVTARGLDQLNETVATIRAAGGRAIAVAGDVTDREAVEQAKAATEEQFGPATILVNNAGVLWPFGPIWHTDPDLWWQAHAIHVRAALLYIHAFVPGMVERRSGRVIIVSSGSGNQVTLNNSGYAVAKSSQIRIAEHLAAEGAEHGIAAFAISPGRATTSLILETMESPEAQRWMPEYVARIRSRLGTRDNEAILRTCGAFCTKLASGDYDLLSGRFLTPEDDLDVLAQAARAEKS